jgi:hypothetical protein
LPQTARCLGLTAAGGRCHGAADHERCDVSLSLANSPELREFYLDQESHDRCVFRDDIDIEDSLSVSVGYDTGASLSYSLNAFRTSAGDRLQPAPTGWAYSPTRHRLSAARS